MAGIRPASLVRNLSGILSGLEGAFKTPRRPLHCCALDATATGIVLCFMGDLSFGKNIENHQISTTVDLSRFTLMSLWATPRLQRTYIVATMPVTSCTVRQQVLDAGARRVRSPILRCLRPLSQLRVFGFGLLEDGDVWVGVFPPREQILISGACLAPVALQCIGAG